MRTNHPAQLASLAALRLHRRRTIGLNIRDLRATRDMRQGQLAALIGVSQPLVSDWETGKLEPTPRHLLLVAHALSVSVAALTSERP